jgi:hypothetical protein
MLTFSSQVWHCLSRHELKKLPQKMQCQIYLLTTLTINSTVALNSKIVPKVV